MKNQTQLWVVDQILDKWIKLSNRQEKIQFRNKFMALIRSSETDLAKELATAFSLDLDETAKNSLAKLNPKIFKMQVMATLEAWEDFM